MKKDTKIMKKRAGTLQVMPEHQWLSFLVKVILYLFLFLFFWGGHIFSDQKWQGNAAMIRKGEFESAGMYASSNSFPLNSKIHVRNLRNNRAAEVIVVQRIPEGMNVFLLLSEEGARQLGMGENDVINVEVSVISFGTGEVIGLPDDLPYNPDLDVYPYVTDEPGVTPVVTPTYTLGPTPEPYPEVTEVPLPEITETPGPEITEEPSPEVTPEPGIEGSPEPEITPESTPEPESAEREPQKNLFLPPHEDERYALVDITKPEGENGTDEVEYKPSEAEIVIEEEKEAEGSIETPKSSEADLAIKDIDSPQVENPVVEDKKTAGKEEEEIILAEADLPVVPEKEIAAPDPSTEVPDMKETEIALVQEEPEPPAGKEKDIPDPSNEVPGAEEKEIAFIEKEPDVPKEKEKAVPDPSGETPSADGEDEAIALITEEPPLPGEEEEKIKPDGIHEYEEEVEITLEETGPSPPPAGDGGEIKEIVEDVSHRIDTKEIESLIPGYYFIQLGAYAEKQLALSIEKKFISIYPIKVYEIKHTKINIYKVLVGPLNKDESDTLLYRFKALGYRDAFVKYIN